MSNGNSGPNYWNCQFTDENGTQCTTRLNDLTCKNKKRRYCDEHVIIKAKIDGKKRWTKWNEAQKLKKQVELITA